MRRLRAHAGLLALLAVMAGLAAFLATAAPRAMNRVEDDALRHDIVGSGPTVRDLTVVGDAGSVRPTELAAIRDSVESKLPEVLGSAVSGRWYAVQIPAGTGLADVFPEFEGKPPMVGLRVQDGFCDALRVNAGDLPAEPDSAGPRGPFRVQAAISARTAEVLKLRVGSRFQINLQGGTLRLRVTVSGIFEPRDSSAPIWADHPRTLRPDVPRPFEAKPPTYLATAVLHPGAAEVLWQLRPTVTFRYHLDERQLHAGRTAEILAAVGQIDSGAHEVPGAYLNTGLDHLVRQFQARRAAAVAVVAVVYAGLLAAMLGVLLLAARLGSQRRRAELELWRARGASLWTLAGRLVGDAAWLVVPAVAAGIGLGFAIPARDAGVPWLALGIGVCALLVLPGFVVPAVRRTRVVAVRAEAAMLRPSVRRLTVEGTVLVLAVLGVVLLRRRGLFQETGIDPYLSAVPVLLGLAAALVMLRIYPWPLRLAGRAAARWRGAVSFLGTTRAGRAAPAAALPLAVLVVAIGVGVFSEVTRASIAEARDRTAWQEVGADIRLRGVAFERSGAASLDAVEGVRAVAPMRYHTSTDIYPADHASRKLGTAVLIAVDAPAYQRVLDAAGIDVRLPEAVRDARPGADELPALVSPDVAALTDHGQMYLGSQRYRYAVADVIDTFPGLLVDTTRFVVLPMQALPTTGPDPVLATDFLIAGAGADLERLVAVAAEEQRDTVARMAPIAAQGLADPSVHTRAQRRAEAERDGFNVALTIAFTAGPAGAAGFALLAIGFTIVVTAHSRGRVLSRLRTLGLSQGAARGLLVWELTPVMAVALLAGTGLGVAMPWLLGPALGLEQFGGGAAPRIVVDRVTVSAAAGLVAVAMVVAILLEAAVNRRRNLGGVLRVGDEE